MTSLPQGLRCPRRLRPGDTIGIVSPGRWMEEEQIQAACRHLREFGYRVFVHSQNRLRWNQLAGRDAERVAALNALFADPEIAAVMFTKGGYGALRIIDNLDYKLIRENPKIVVGYSDATALLLSILIRSKVVTFHGPMLYDLAGTLDLESWQSFEAVVGEGATEYRQEKDLRVLRAGKGCGELVGGNLSLLVNLIGTPDDIKSKGKILFIEDDEEELYSIDRMLVHLKRSGKLADLAGLIVGRFTRIPSEPIPFGLRLEEICLEHCEGTSYPIVAGFPVGHLGRSYTLPLGRMAEMAAEDKESFRLRLCQAAVE
jgi:muramoyltetrapeptide carboxypeptidase